MLLSVDAQRTILDVCICLHIFLLNSHSWCQFCNLTCHVIHLCDELGAMFWQWLYLDYSTMMRVFTDMVGGTSLP